MPGVSEEQIAAARQMTAEAVRFVFGLTPAEIISQLNLLTPRYTQTAALSLIHI